MTLLDTITGPNTVLLGGSNGCPCPRPAIFLGNAWTNNALPIGTTSITITGLTFYVYSVQNQAYTDVVARFEFWNTYNGGTDPIFSNGTLVTIDLGPQNFFNGSKNRFSITLPSPVTLTGGPSTNWWGFTENFQGNTGSGLKDTNDLAAVKVYRTSGNYPAGTITSPGVFPKFGFFENRSSGRLDFNFNRNDGFAFIEADALAQGIGIIISGTANTGPVPTPTPTPTPSPSPTTITLTVPTNPVVVPATNSSGAFVQYSVSAVDTSGVTPAINCAPPPGNFPIGFTTVICTATGPSGSQTKSFLVTVTPLSKRFTHDQKKQFEDVSEALHLIGEITERLPDVIPEAEPYRAPLTLLSLTCLVSSVHLNNLSNDPPDPDYTSIIQPASLKYQPVSVSITVTANVANAFNALLANQAQAAGLAQAILITNNRADGAMEAHDAGWEQKQMQAAATYATQLAALLASQPQLLVNLQTALSANGFPTMTMTQSQLDDFKSSVTKNGLPASMSQALTQMGVDQATINNIRGLISTRDAKPGVFPALLSDSSTQGALRTSAQGLRAFALNNIAGQKNVNAVDDAQFFVTQHYLDFLNRAPDPPGLAGWTSTINNCAGDTTQCDRVHVSEAFFKSEEFQQRGYFIYRFYSASLGRKPDYAEFGPDLGRVSGFLDANQLEAAKVAFISDFMTRSAFGTKYNSLGNQQFVNTLLTTAAVTLSNRQALIDGLNSGTLTRAAVLRQIVESNETYQKYYNQAFVVMQYFGYLRRDPDILYLNWIAALDSGAVSRTMVTGFVNSAEYRQRFGQ